MHSSFWIVLILLAEQLSMAGEVNGTQSPAMVMAKLWSSGLLVGLTTLPGGTLGIANTMRHQRRLLFVLLIAMEQNANQDDRHSREKTVVSACA